MGRPVIPVVVQRRFWSAMREGVTIEVAGSGSGVLKTVAWGWFREAGGMMPPVVTSDPSAVASSLSFGERDETRCRRASRGACDRAGVVTGTLFAARLGTGRRWLKGERIPAPAGRKRRF